LIFFFVKNLDIQGSNILFCNAAAYSLNFISGKDDVNNGWIRMPEEFEEIRNIGLTTLLRVSVQGDGLYLYIPKNIIEVYGIMAGDRIEVKLGTVHREKKYVKRAKKIEA